MTPHSSAERAAMFAETEQEQKRLLDLAQELYQMEKPGQRYSRPTKECLREEMLKEEKWLSKQRLLDIAEAKAMGFGHSSVDKSHHHDKEAHGAQGPRSGVKRRNQSPEE